ncbi:hypothetical protein D3C75_569070 [compost metagenome]
MLAQVGDGLQCPGNQRRVLGDFFDLQRHETLVDGGDVIVGRRAAEHFAITLGNFRQIAQGADVVPLAHAHRAAGFFDGHLDVELGEGLDENLRRGEGAEVDHGAGPVEDGGLQFGWVGVVHGDQILWQLADRGAALVWVGAGLLAKAVYQPA